MQKLASALAAAALLCAGTARANAAAIQLYPSRVAPPSFAARTALEVEDESLLLCCAGEVVGLTCRFEATYAVHNPTEAVERAVGAFWGERTQGVEVYVDGSVAGRELSADEAKRLDEAVDAVAGDMIRARIPTLSPVDAATRRYGFEIEVGAGGRKRLVARGTMVPGARWISRPYTTPAIESRHMLLGRKVRERIWDLEYVIAPLWTWKGKPPIRVELCVHDPFEVDLSGGWAKESARGFTVFRRTYPGGEAPAALFALISHREIPIENGGVLLGIGGAFGPRGGLRARLGYEAGTQGWLLGSAVVETDFSSRVQIVPALEAASSVLFVIPSFGIGAGVAIQLAPEVRAGIRLQGSAMFFPAGVFLAVDLYPGTGSSDGYVEASLMLQAGF